MLPWKHLDGKAIWHTDILEGNIEMEATTYINIFVKPFCFSYIYKYKKLGKNDVVLYTRREKKSKN